ncbi:MAG TPA: GMC family oxidoreductase [Burkholderiaceae bacterium]|nr:GMC family oxidoreductase [Burkholderiaceae bacterium]
MSITASIGEALAGGRAYDVCIIGSGAAGLTIANELGARGQSVLVLEAGGESYDEKSQAEYEGDFFGPLKFQFPIDVCRLRFFGGTTNHWGGFCRTLDDYDFRTKVNGIATAWPITRGDLDPFLGRAGEYLQIPAIAPDVPLDDNVKQVQVVYSPPVHYGSKFREPMQKSARVTVALNACAVDLRERDGDIVELEVRDPSNGRHYVRARRYVLAAGAIENSRLLLWSNRRNEGRVVKDATTLGRYFMEHPHFSIGEVIAAPELGLTFDAWNISWVAPTEQAIRRYGILNCGLRIQPKRYEDDTKKLIATLGCVAPDLGRWALRKVRKSLICGLQLRASWEQSPQAWNRVVLANRPDSFGTPRADVHWRLGDFERRSVRTSATLYGEYLVRKNLGRVRLDPWVLGEADFPNDDEKTGNHHMGGTRMSRNARDGVVDADCRVHGLRNLFVAGSSVFPSAGHANPTLTIVQLALRLADHLAA